MRWLRGAVSLVVLLVLLVGTPWALLRWGTLPDFGGGWSTLLHPDDGRLLRSALTGTAWLAWAVFAGSTLLEAANLISSGRLRLVVPILAAPRALAAGMLAAVIAMTLVRPGAPEPAPAAQASVAAIREVPVAATPPAAAESQVLAKYTVRAGDDLWSLAQRAYGDGTQWRRIAEANPDLEPAGDLVPGARLIVPDADLAGLSAKAPPARDGAPPGSVQPSSDAPDSMVATEASAAVTTSPSPARPRVAAAAVAPGLPADPFGPATKRVRVEAGDTLSALAERYLGDPDAWPRIYELNRDQIDDPDQIDVGWVLLVPDEKAPPVKPKPHDDDRSERHKVDPRDDETPTNRVKPRVVGPHERARPGGLEIPAEVPDAPREKPPTTSPAEPAVSPAIDPAYLLVGGVGALLAAAVVTGLRARRDLQLRFRPVGRRIVQPDPVHQRYEAALGVRQRPTRPDLRRLALTAVATQAALGREPLPELESCLVEPDAVTLGLGTGAVDLPGFTATERGRCLTRNRVADLCLAPDLPFPYPALVTLGDVIGEGRGHRDGDSAPSGQLLVDLETGPGLSIEGGEEEARAETLAALLLDLATAPWAEQVELIVAGPLAKLITEVSPSAREAASVDELLAAYADRLAERRIALGEGTPPASARLDPDRADAWAAVVFATDQPLTAAQGLKVAELAAGPPLGVSLVLAGGGAPPQAARLVLDTAESPAPRRAADAASPSFAATDFPLRRLAPLAPPPEPESQGVAIGSGELGARYTPGDHRVRPQRLPRAVRRAIAALYEATGSSETSPAPWWHHGPQADNVTVLHPRPAFKESDLVDEPGSATPLHPILRLIGPIELVGTTGPLPNRAIRQCQEYCAWLLEHPGLTASAMANSLIVAEATRRSNMSRLRTWLGRTPTGAMYLPDAYSGRIFLDPAVSSDWHRLQILIGPGINRVGEETLVAALKLVRGAPLANAAPGQWHWAESLRTDISSTIRDIGVVLAERAIETGQVDLARWATGRALLAAPEDEALLRARINAENRAGNRAEVERLALRLTRHARTLGVDLDDDTVFLLQEVMEGRPRARLA